MSCEEGWGVIEGRGEELVVSNKYDETGVFRYLSRFVFKALNRLTVLKLVMQRNWSFPLAPSAALIPRLRLEKKYL